MKFDSVHLGTDMASFQQSAQYDGYSRVVITAEDTILGQWGNDTGRTLTVDCPLLNSADAVKLAKDILQQLTGYQYQPYQAVGAWLDPAAELGDGITAAGIYGGIFSQKLKFGPAMTGDVSAPTREEIDHEYPCLPSRERSVRRKMKELAASLTVQTDGIRMAVEQIDEDINGQNGIKTQLSVLNGKISAKVDRQRDNASFGWDLTATSWTLSANGSEVLKATKNGITVTGKIVATGGTIGGFSIGDCLSYNNQTWGGTNKTGIYIGPSGIQLGKNFSVSSGGALKAKSGSFGSLSVDDKGTTVGSYSGNIAGCSVGSKSLAQYVGDIAAGKITADEISSKLERVNDFRFAGETVKAHWIQTEKDGWVKVLATQF